MLSHLQEVPSIKTFPALDEHLFLQIENAVTNLDDKITDEILQERKEYRIENSPGTFQIYGIKEDWGVKYRYNRELFGLTEKILFYFVYGDLEIKEEFPYTLTKIFLGLD